MLDKKIAVWLLDFPRNTYGVCLHVLRMCVLFVEQMTVSDDRGCATVKSLKGFVSTGTCAGGNIPYARKLAAASDE